MSHPDENRIDWAQVSERIDALAVAHFAPAAMQRRGWKADLIESLKDLARSPYRTGQQLSDDDILFLAQGCHLIEFTYTVRLGNNTTGQELLFPHRVRACSEDEAALTAVRAFKTDPVYEGLRGPHPDAWSAWGVD